MARIAVVGAGAWGTALAAHAARLDNDVLLWARESEVVPAINDKHENEVFLSGVPLPTALKATNDLQESVRARDIVLLVAPAQHLRSVASALKPHLDPSARVLVASKGIEVTTRKLMSEVLDEVLPETSMRVGFLSGPSFAREVALGLPTDVVVASRTPAVVQSAMAAMHSPSFRVYSSADPIGVEVGGAMKNVMAIAAGACDGLNLGTNARAAIITRGLAEMTRLGVALGADPLTFLGMSGVGDLVLTCTGPLSRNRTLGMKIAEGTPAAEYLKSQRTVAEGYPTAKAARDLARERGIDAPITDEVYQVLHEGKSLLEALRSLVTRGSSEELYGIRASK